MSIVEKDLESRWWKLEEEREKRRKDEIETHWQREGELVTEKPKEKHTRWEESRREVQKDEKDNKKRRNEAFVRSVRQSGGGIIGLINNTDRDVTFTSKRFLLPRCQVFDPKEQEPDKVFTPVLGCQSWQSHGGGLGVQERRVAKLNRTSRRDRALGRMEEAACCRRDPHC